MSERKHPHYLRQYFVWDHLRDDLRAIVVPFAQTAEFIDDKLPDNPEKTTALRKLLEAKDCAVRAMLFADPRGPQPSPPPFRGDIE